MVSRPFFNAGIEDLEQELARCATDAECLRRLLHELSYRSTPKALALKVRVEKAIEAAEHSQHSHSASNSVPSSPPYRPPAPIETSRSSSPPPPGQADAPTQVFVRADSPSPEVTNTPGSILDAWTALEVLSPQIFRRPEDLASGDRRAVASLEEKLPWVGIGEKARPNTRLFYQVVLGTMGFGAAIERLLSLYADSRAERPAARGEVVLAAVTVNREGRLVERPAAAVSSFAWAVPHALRGDLTSLAAWRAEEGKITEALDDILRGSTDDDDNPALSREMMKRAYEWLLTRLGLPPDLTTPPRFAIRVYSSFRGSDSPEPLLMSSFFLGDLATARTMFSEGRATDNLRLYVGERTPPQTKDLLRDQEALDAAVAPGITPPARWPGRGRHPLVSCNRRPSIWLSRSSSKGASWGSTALRGRARRRCYAIWWPPSSPRAPRSCRPSTTPPRH